MKFVDNGIVDYKVLADCLLKLLTLVVLTFATRGIGSIVLFVMIVLSLVRRRPDNLFFVILATIAMTMSNSYLVPKTVVSFSVMRGSLLLVAVLLPLLIFGRNAPRPVSPLMLIMLYMGYISVVSLSGWSPVISSLKAFLFVMIFFAFYGVSCLILGDGRVRQSQVRAVVLSIAIYFLFGSVCLIPFPGIGLMRAEELLINPDLASLFQGITNHSQCLGPCCAILGTIVLGDLLLGVRRKSWLHIFLLCLVPILIYKTSSRTALGSAMVGGGCIVFLFLQARGIRSRWRSRVLNMTVLLGIVASAVVVASPGARRSATAFLNKRGDLDRSVDVTSIIEARSGTAESCMANFRRSPFVGNGFQVSEDMSRISLSDFKSLLSAPIEKGFIWVAILEEGGAFGFAIFVLVMLVMMFKLYQRHAYIGLSTMIVFLVCNTGEFCFFSMSYTGGICWACVFMGVVLDAFRQRDDWREREQRRQMAFCPPQFPPWGGA